MEYSSRHLEQLVDEFARLPSIGRKTAQRLAFFILEAEPEDALRLAHAVEAVKEKVRRCRQCGNIADDDVCLLCSDARRAADLVCVVEQPSDVVALEKTGRYRGLYHVLHGSLSPLDQRGPDELNLQSLVERVKGGLVREVILATNPNVNGEATANYISERLKPLGVSVSRIAVGVPMGSDIEYSDQSTLGRALEGRRKME
ncbi:MAG TPA: recombination mediator RecR [Candidatus Saccharimonadales bacterium]|nr:recombination mediator RecR [Candidatus Saccharimonadales bacterium]